MKKRSALGLMGALAAVLFVFLAPAALAKTTVCHVPPGNPSNAHEISVGDPSVPSPHGTNHPDNGGCGEVTTTTPTPAPTAAAPTAAAAAPGAPGGRGEAGQPGGGDEGAGVAGGAGVAQQPGAGARGQLDQLAFTGIETLWLALLGGLLVASGLVLRARSDTA